MRGVDGRLIADLNDPDPANVTGSVITVEKSEINENLTSYNLLPELINSPPYFTTSIYDSSEPRIKPIQYNNESSNFLYVDEAGVVKVLIGTSFRLKARANQPPIYNVENGVPTILIDTDVSESDVRTGLPDPVQVRSLESSGSFLEDDLIYSWYKDDVVFALDQVDEGRPESKIFLENNNKDLVFTSISPGFAGTYYCEVSNDIGTVTTEQIVIEVYNPDAEDIFFTNLVQNPYGQLETDQWSSADDGFVATKLSTAPFTEFSKPWNQDVFGYSIDMFYPRPYHINTYHIKNDNLVNDLLTNGSYFTRDGFTYFALGGRPTITAEHDIDLASIRDYIQGAVYGVNGVRAVLGCYIGNAVSRFTQTIITAVIERRNYIYSVDPASPKLSVYNALAAGIPKIEESVVVTVTEYDNETPLLSEVLNDETGEVLLLEGVSFNDPWTDQLMNFTQSVNLVPTPIASGFQSTGNTREEKIIASTQALYPSSKLVPTLGQYVKWNRAVISKLNFKTNKIRITLRLDLGSGTPLEETWYKFLADTETPAEEFSWQGLVKPFWWPQTEDALLKIGGDIVTQFEYNKVYTLGAELASNEDEQPPITDYTPLRGQPRAMATAFNVVLFPIEEQHEQKTQYYTKNVLQGFENQTYPNISSSLQATDSRFSELINELQSYTSSIIAVDITNNYNVPVRVSGAPNTGLFFSGSYPTYLNNTNVDAISNKLENLKAQGKLASATTIATYRFLNDTDFTRNIPTNNITEAVEDVGTTNWKGVAPYDELSAKQLTLTGESEKVLVLYNPLAESISEVGIPQITGQLRSSLIKFTSQPVITSIPSSYELTEVDLNGFIESIQVNLELQLQERGLIRQSGSITPQISQDDWKYDPPQEAPTIQHEHKLFIGGDDFNNTTAPRQVFFYSEEARSTSRVYASKYYRTGSVYDLDTNEYSQTILNDLNWTRNLENELIDKLQLAGYSWDPNDQKTQQERVVNIIKTNRVDADTIGYANDRILDLENIDNNETQPLPYSSYSLATRLAIRLYINTSIGLNVPISPTVAAAATRKLLSDRMTKAASADIRRQYGSEGTLGTSQAGYPTRIENTISSQGMEVTSIFDEDGNLVACDLVKTMRVWTGTFDHIKLTNVSPTNNHLTPAAIIYPAEKKVYYFIYSYTDNYLNETV